MKASRFIHASALGAVAAALTFAAVPASAQDRDDNGHRHEHGQQAQPNNGGGRPQAPAQAQPQAQQGQRQQWQGRQPQAQQGQRPQPQGNFWRDQRTNAQAQQVQRPQPAQRQQWQGQQDRNRAYADPNRGRDYGAYRGQGYNGNRGGYNNAYRGPNQGYRGDTRQWNRGWRGDNRYDWQRYRATNRNVFRLSPYYSPYRGYSYRRFGVGAVLNNLFYAENYWIADPWQYRLPDVYGPYHWVRYYNDALLVDVYSGEVVDVIYDFFW